MRRMVHSTALALALLAAGLLAQSRAEAMMQSYPAAIKADIDSPGPAQGVAYTCHRVWRCGPYDCGWRRICSWAGWRSSWRSRPYWRHHQSYRHYW
jgi:hypothetical protein